MINRPVAITKVLSANDTGETGGHQAGLLVPKSNSALGFFPDLGNSTKNPRVVLRFIDDAGKSWKLNFIYYNNKFFDAKGTRNEYRLTGMTAFFREYGLKAGDSVTLIHSDNGDDLIRFERAKVFVPEVTVKEDGTVKRRLKLDSEWRVINC